LTLSIALTLALAACSSGSDTAEPSPAGETPTEESVAATPDEIPDDDDAGGDYDCDELTGYAITYRAAAAPIGVTEDQETMDASAIDFDALEAAIEGLRPIQDIDGIFGPIRENLDNMVFDIQALRDGRFAEKKGDYGAAGLVAVIGEEVCG
jgi:hypothetical protein